MIQYQNEAFEKTLEAYISDCYDQFRAIIPDAPETVQIYFGSEAIMDETGVGAFAYSPEIISLSLDPNFKDRARQLADIKPSIFHECFHQYQDFTSASQLYSAIEGAIYEGMATVFEREYAGSKQPYGDYSKLREEDLKKWVDELTDLNDAGYHKDESTWRAWKFYHPDYKQEWIAYKVGTWITDQVISRYKLNILKLSKMTAKEVLDLFEAGISVAGI